MTTALDTVRYSCGMAGEEVAELVDELEKRVILLDDQLAESQAKYQAALDRICNQEDLIRDLQAKVARLEEEVKTWRSVAARQDDAIQQENARLIKQLSRLETESIRRDRLEVVGFMDDEGNVWDNPDELLPTDTPLYRIKEDV